MNPYSITEVMEMAVQTERLGNQFYTSMAEKFKADAALVKLFNTLAAKEKEHERVFSDLKNVVAASKPAPVQWEDVTDYLRAFVESEFFLGKGKSLPSLDRVRSVRDAVDFALGFEKETLLYYLEVRTIVPEKSAMDQLINEEKSHIAWLSKFKAGLKK
jgi:rubrerythrin